MLPKLIYTLRHMQAAFDAPVRRVDPRRGIAVAYFAVVKLPVVLYWPVLKIMDACYCLDVHIIMKTLSYLNLLIFTILINSC